ncbi:hypothetical protein [Bacillus sp. Marseille-P3661]|uniref:hypothetical protein n=1 Tax=Bacillus sp. Marseille-P3661 TaxID=1936234 RepID=UPI000C828325|nr:hypothetical protein [Bacillus sp. Marseille-P3661]
MVQLNISENETLKRFQFIEEIMKPHRDFRKQVLASFFQVFGYSKGVFWQTNESGSTFSHPITLKISEE